MKRFELPYQVLLARNAFPMKLVRAFYRWSAYEWTGFENLILIDDNLHQRVIVFKYETRSEMEDDLELLRRLNDDDGESAGVSAWLPPVPPRRAASNACPIPTDSAD